MYRRFAFAMILVGVIAISVLVGRRSSATPSPATQPASAPHFEYRVMSLLEMFGNTESGVKKMAALMVQTPGGVNRIDMDSADYQEALNRLAGQGWETVTVNKSNYWVFRRPKGQATGG